ncbi:hypothetical protein DMH08_01550 [Actinomadura sp. WAC 06369]|nr:hypothetical protein DMH08_01550 [Actinomadura sp. WAC 06369]
MSRARRRASSGAKPRSRRQAVMWPRRARSACRTASSAAGSRRAHSRIARSTGAISRPSAWTRRSRSRGSAVVPSASPSISSVRSCAHRSSRARTSSVRSLKCQ